MFDFMLCGGIISVLVACATGAVTRSFQWLHMAQLLPILLVLSFMGVAGTLFIFLALQLIPPVFVGALRCLEIVLALAIDLTVAAVNHDFERGGGLGGIHTAYKVAGSLIVTLAVILLGFADNIHQKIFARGKDIMPANGGTSEEQE